MHAPVILHILKIEGTSVIPDYIKIRNKEFILIAYFKITNPARALTRCGLLDKMDKIIKIAENIPYGKIEKLLVG